MRQVARRVHGGRHPRCTIHIAKEVAMRILMASISLSAMLLLSGCASFQKYPAFGRLAGAGRIVTYDRQGARNLLPPSHAEPVVVPQSQYSVIR